MSTYKTAQLAQQNVKILAMLEAEMAMSTVIEEVNRMLVEPINHFMKVLIVIVDHTIRVVLFYLIEKLRLYIFRIHARILFQTMLEFARFTNEFSNRLFI